MKPDCFIPVENREFSSGVQEPRNFTSESRARGEDLLGGFPLCEIRRSTQRQDAFECCWSSLIPLMVSVGALIMSVNSASAAWQGKRYRCLKCAMRLHT
jgi:hypothetical protein